MNSIIRFFATQGIFSNLITVFVFVFGTISLLMIKREVFPNVSYDIITVTTIYPGASPEEVEKFVTNPLEQAIREVDGIKKMSSTSSESVSTIVVQLDPDATTEAKAKDDLRDVIDTVTDLPDDAEDPMVLAIESKLQPVVEVSLSGDVSEDELRAAAKALELRLENIGEVAKVNINGKRDIEYWIEADPVKLQRFRLTLQSVSAALRGQNINLPGGLIDGKSADGSRRQEYIVRTMGELRDQKDIENVVLTANAIGQPILLKDVATVQQTYERRSIGFRANGNPAMNLVVLKKEKADAVTLVEKVKLETDLFQKSLNPKISVAYINDLSYFIKRRLSVLSSNLVIGLVLVLIVLSMMLPWRTALMTSFGIPFAFLGAMIYFQVGDISFNLITMMGLIIVSGMLVDDAIVVTENIQRLADKGMDKLEAAIQGTQQMWAPVTVSVLTTIMAFAPMMFMSGIFGKFIAAIPLGVISALLISLWEVFFLLPHHFVAWTGKSVSQTSQAPKLGWIAKWWESKAVPSYVKLLKSILTFRYVVAIGTAVFFFASLWFAKNYMKIILFPPGGIEAFQIAFEAPDGTPLEETERLVQPIEEALQKMSKEEVTDYVFTFGRIQAAPDRPTTGLGGQYGMAIVYLTAATERSRDSIAITDDLREQLKDLPGFKRLVFSQVQGGPPVGKPVNIGVRGENYEEINAAVAAVEAELKTIKGVSDLESSFKLGKKEVRLRADSVELAAAGLSVFEVGRTVRAAFEGVVETSLRTLDEEIQLRVLLPEISRQSKESMGLIEIPNLRGNLIPLRRVVRIEEGQGIANFEHEDNRRQVTLSGEIDVNVTTALEVTAKMTQWVNERKAQFPNVTFHFGGENEDTSESLQSLGLAFAVAFFGIFFIMVLLFQNLIQPLVIVSAIPLGIISVIWALFLNNAPLSFMAFLGIVALAGVIVNNAIVFVDFVNQARLEGMGLRASIFEAGQSRIRPIVLTTITTSAGLLPTAYGIGGSDPFVVPIALALGWGVLVGAMLTLVILPAILAVTDDLRILSRKLLKMEALGSVGRSGGSQSGH